MTETSAIYALAIASAGVAFGAFAWLAARSLNEGAEAYAKSMGAEASRALEDTFLFIPPAKLARLGLAGALAAFFLFFIPLLSFTSVVSTAAGLALGIAAGILAFSIPGRYAAFLKERRRLKFDSQLVDAISAMSNALRAGFSISQAFESVVETGEMPISQEFGLVLRQQRVGMSFDEALASLEARIGSDDMTLVATSIDIARKTGGNLTEIFDRISETIRARMRIERRVRTLTAQGRMQGLVVSFMPVILGVALTVMKPGLMIPFFTSAGGIVATALAAALVILGWLVIRRIVRIDV